MNTALVVAYISAAVALVSAAFSGWTQLHLMKRGRRLDAKAVLDRYRGPLLDAAWQLGDRLENIRHGSFFDYLSQGSGRAGCEAYDAVPLRLLPRLARVRPYSSPAPAVREREGHQAGRWVPQ
jgi:hypothetical protein